MARKFVQSYRDLDFTVYQIGRKFRDDHARKGLLRTKEFTMKDAYSFHTSQKALDKKFEEMLEVYSKIFDRLGLEYSVVGADNGSMGGSQSREFLAESTAGSDTYMKCKNCCYGTKNLETKECAECGHKLKEVQGIEVGHCFKLGTLYSEAMNLEFTDQNGEKQSVIMGCYGIGVSRLISAIIEQNNDEKGINWNEEVSAFNTGIVVAVEDKEVFEKAEEIYNEVEGEALLYDGEMSVGEKFAEIELIGCQRKIILGRNYLQTGSIEVEDRDGETV
jgi:prolyl-tRNA synthetase